MLLGEVVLFAKASFANEEAMAPHVPLQRAIQGIDVVVVVVVEEDDLEVDEELGDGMSEQNDIVQFNLGRCRRG